MTRASAILAYVALGANMGDRRLNIQTALTLLPVQGSLLVLKVSSFVENPAVGGPSGSPAFLNAVAEVETTLAPGALLRRLLDVEQELGRVRLQKWEPRVIDLDLILYGDQVIHEPDLVIPHPLMHERKFVLGPLAEIAPGIIHPILGLSAARLLENLSSSA